MEDRPSYKRDSFQVKGGSLPSAQKGFGHYHGVRFGYLDGLPKHNVTAQSIDENAKIIEKTGEDAAVLLKNEGGVLPLKAADLDQVVLIGPGAGQVMTIGINGERSACPSGRSVARSHAEDSRQLENPFRRGRRHDRQHRAS